MSGPGLAKYVYEEGIILILASTKFPLTSFAWKIKKKITSELRNIENWWFPSLEALKKYMLSGIQYSRLFCNKNT